jgi:hypothetical protein
LRNLLLVTITLLATAALGASFEDLPKRKPGLWEMTMMPVDTQRPPTTSRVCIDTATDAMLTDFGLGISNQVCSRRDISIRGSVATIEAVCKIGTSQQTTRSTITYTGNTGYKTEIKAQYDPPFLGKTESTTSQEAKWTGPCPPDMKPGDLVMGNGIKVNLRDLAASKK